MNTSYPYGGFPFRPLSDPSRVGRVGLEITEQQVRSYEKKFRIGLWQLYGKHPAWWTLNLDTPQLFDLRIINEDASGVTLGWYLNESVDTVWAGYQTIKGYLGEDPWAGVMDSMGLLGPDATSLFIPAPLPPAKVLIQLQPFGSDLGSGPVYRRTLTFS